jgi:hypothetical protein
LATGDGPVGAQWGDTVPTGSFELAETVELDQVDNAVLAQLDRVKALLADRQWDEAVEILRQLAEAPDGKLLAATDRRYVSLREWCQLQLAALPAEALKLYRARVDSIAQKWYEQGIAERDRGLLRNVVEQAFASSYGDDALLALGEMAFESGNYAAARSQWERIVLSTPPSESAAPGGQSHFRGDQANLPDNVSGAAKIGTVPCPWPGYPDTDLDLAAVRARLVLASILEGSAGRAQAELVEFARLHPEARGRLGGRDGEYADLLRTLLAESTSWPAAPSDPNWPTFAGNPQRNRIAPPLVDVGAVLWRVPLRPAATDANHHELLSFHSLLSGKVLLVSDARRILALRRDTGQPAWGHAEIFQDDRPDVTAEVDGHKYATTEAPGVPGFTMTLFQNRLYARMGSVFASPPHGALAGGQPGCLVCLDMAAEGRLLWKVELEDGWALEGAPVADAQGVYVAVRRWDIRAQTYVACFDPDTGQLRWRRFVCAADTPTRSVCEMLTLVGGTIYYNTNLGAVAALRADDGRPLWLSLYPRERRGDRSKLAPHWRRGLNPCVFDRGTLLVAPVDSPRLFAFDAAGGQMLWQTGSEVEDADHLLGVAGDWLIAGGRKLYWISLKEEDRGRVRHVWPDGDDEPGYGRGVLAGQSVLWPTRDKLYIFDQLSAQPQKVVDLTVRGVTGGNLLVADGRLLIATESELIAIDPFTKPRPAAAPLSFTGRMRPYNTNLW